MGLPYPYIVPAVGHFDEMYYWDTYFTNVGLILAGRAMQAKFNVDNMLNLISRFGFMPNGNRTYYLTRSQAPFLSYMVADIFEHFNDRLRTFFSGKQTNLSSDERFNEFYTNFFADAFICSIERWIMTKNCLKSDEFARLLRTTFEKSTIKLSIK